MIEILIVDDEKAARDRLARLVGDLANDQWHVAALCENGQQAVDFCNSNNVDIVLMDIRMPVMDGIQAAGMLAEMPSPPAVIFTTAFGEYALDAFDAQGTGYLLKPVKKEKLQEALQRSSRLTRVQQQAVADDKEDQAYISGQFRGALVRVPVTELIYFMAEDKYVTAYTQDKQLLVDEPLKVLEQRYAGLIVRVHRNALAVTEKLVGIEQKQNQPVYALLQGTETKLEISRRHVPEVKQLILG